MDINDIGFDNEKFGEVWDRVMSEGGQSAKPQMNKDEEARTLRAFMDAECEAVQHVRAISARCCVHIRAVLGTVIECDRRHFKELRARYFILTGERYTPPELCPVVGTVIEALRSVYITKLRIAEEYIDASDAARERLVSESYDELAEEEENTAGLINDVITRLLG